MQVHVGSHLETLNGKRVTNNQEKKMLPANERHASMNRARRHFLGVAVAAGAKVAAISAVTVAAPTPVYALGRRWWKRGHGKDHHDGKSTGDSEPVSGTADGGNPGGSIGEGARCFLRGTVIKTPGGGAKVEDLRIGDTIETFSGKALAIRWVGRQTFKKSGHVWSECAMPIRVARHALDECTPHADLYLSPNHALLIDGVLIRVKELVNGVTIAPALPGNVGQIEYFSIVLDSHEVVLAEGAPVESFLYRANNHERFANFTEYDRLYPAHLRRSMTPYAPVLGYEGGWEHLRALLLLGVSRFVRVNDPIQTAYERIAARADHLANC
jgi:hypothetical protein